MRLITALLVVLAVTLGCSQPRIVLPSALAKTHTVVPVKLKRNATFFRKKNDIQDAYQLKIGAVQTTSINRERTIEVETPKAHLKVSKETMTFSYSIAHDVPETVFCEHIYGAISVSNEVSEGFIVSSEIDTRQTITCESEVIVETVESPPTTPTGDDAEAFGDAAVHGELAQGHSIEASATADNDATNRQGQPEDGEASAASIQAQKSMLAATATDTAGTKNTTSPSSEALSQSSQEEAVSQPPEAVSQPLEAVSQPLEAVSQPPEAVSQPPEAVSQPLEAVSQPPEAVSQPPEAVSQPAQEEAELIGRLNLFTASKTGEFTTSLEYAGVSYRVNKLSRLGHSKWTGGVNGYEVLRENKSIGAIQTTPPLRMYTLKNPSSNDRAAIIFLLSSIAYNNALLPISQMTHF